VYFVTFVTHAGIAAGVGRAFIRVCLFVCLSVCKQSNRKTARAISTKLGTRILYSSRLACIDLEVKRSRSHSCENSWSLLLVTMAGIPYTYTPLCYLRPLPVWVCMSIRLLMFSTYVCFRSSVLSQEID